MIMVQCCNGGLVECLNDRMRECVNDGVLEWWNDGMHARSDPLAIGLQSDPESC